MNKVVVFLSLLLVIGCSAPKDQGHGGGPGGFSVPVVGVKIVPQVLQNKIMVVGSLAANEKVDIKSEVEGQVSAVHFDEGQYVTKGYVLIELDAAKLNAQLAEAVSNHDLANSTFTRVKTLVDSGAVSKQEFDRAEAELAAKKAQMELISAQRDDMIITAPFDGVVADRQVSVGQVIDQQRVLTTIIDDSPMKLDFHVPERLVSRLEKGQQITLTVAAYPKQQFSGEVFFIDPQVDLTTRTVLVKALVPNDEHLLKAGMFARLDLITDENPSALLVPESALVLKSDDVFVFTVGADGMANLKPVKTGIRQAGLVEITEGIAAGDTVITEGIQKIGPGMPVQVSAPGASMTPPPSIEGKS